MKKRVEIESSWYAMLEDEFEKPYFLKLIDEVRQEYKTKTNIYIYIYSVSPGRD